LEIRTILGLTATITKLTEQSICKTLKIENVMRINAERTNLKITISQTTNDDRYKDLLNLMQTERFESIASIIIYVMFRNDSDSISDYLNMNSIQSASYHSGMEISEKKIIEKNFFSNKIRVLVGNHCKIK
jgi:superfamily II DNA helicase RecQ